MVATRLDAATRALIGELVEILAPFANDLP
jgi:hypothetical protein